MDERAMNASQYKRPGWPAVIPRIFVADVEGLVNFIKSALGADGRYEPARPTELQIGDSLLLVSDGGGVRDPAPAALYVYVPDADAAYRRAIDAGAISVEAPSDQFYGDRRATVTDPWGNFWQFATYRKN